MEPTQLVQRRVLGKCGDGGVQPLEGHPLLLLQPEVSDTVRFREEGWDRSAALTARDKWHRAACTAGGGGLKKRDAKSADFAKVKIAKKIITKKTVFVPLPILARPRHSAEQPSTTHSNHHMGRVRFGSPQATNHKRFMATLTNDPKRQ